MVVTANHGLGTSPLLANRGSSAASTMRSLRSTFEAPPQLPPHAMYHTRLASSISTSRKLPGFDPAIVTNALMSSAMPYIIEQQAMPNGKAARAAGTRASGSNARSTFGTGPRFVDGSYTSTGLLVPHTHFKEPVMTHKPSQVIAPRTRVAPSGKPLTLSRHGNNTNRVVLRPMKPTTWTADSLASLTQTIDRMESRSDDRPRRRVIPAEALRATTPPKTAPSAEGSSRTMSTASVIMPTPPPTAPAAQPVLLVDTVRRSVKPKPRKRVTFCIEEPIEEPRWPYMETWLGASSGVEHASVVPYRGHGSFTPEHESMSIPYERVVEQWPRELPPAGLASRRHATPRMTPW